MTGEIPPNGYHPVPRDDRLFDILPQLTRHRGIELWEKWTPDTVEFIAIKFQDTRSEPEHISIPRPELEQRLLHYLTR